MEQVYWYICNGNAMWQTTLKHIQYEYTILTADTHTHYGHTVGRVFGYTDAHRQIRPNAMCLVCLYPQRIRAICYAP